MRFEIKVTLKATITDPQGLTIKHALESLGYGGLGKVRIGKLIVLELASEDKKDACEQVDQMCRKLLANPVIEKYTYRIIED